MNDNITKLLANGDIAATVAELNKNPALLSETDDNGVVLAHKLATSGAIKYIHDLVTQEVLELVTPPLGWTTLHCAAAAGNIAALDGPLKKHGARVMHWKDDRGEIAAHVAARYGYLAGFPPEMLTPFHFSTCNNFGQTALHLAAENKHLDQISHKYDPVLLLYRDLAGQTVLEIAEANGAVDQLPGPLVIRARLIAAQVAKDMKSHA